jgi:hypothetical protein
LKSLTHHIIRPTKIRVLELVPLARIVLADLEAAVAGSLAEAPLSLEEDDEADEGVEVMDVDVEKGEGGEAAKPEAAKPAAMEQDDKKEAAAVEVEVEVVVVVVDSQTQGDAVPTPEKAQAKPEPPHPRVPGKWEAAEFARVAAWVLALPLPPFFEEADMERAAVKKAFGKLQVHVVDFDCGVVGALPKQNIHSLPFPPSIYYHFT